MEYQIAPEEAERCVSDVLQLGYRMVDTAQAYLSESGVGAAVNKSGIARAELFLYQRRESAITVMSRLRCV